ncbi:MAG: hypothetical protein KGL39_39800 [Patescibacteria group bacterium]|nr:hypothetical protein [Patescibacteria group bacterium]
MVYSMLETTRKLRTAIEASQRYGGYILPLARSVGAEFRDVAWGDFARELSAYGYWGGHAESSVKRAFEAGRLA